MAYTLDKANEPPSTRDDAVLRDVLQPRHLSRRLVCLHDATRPAVAHGTGKMPEVNDYKWELYDLTEDFSQNNDLAAKDPEKLKEMQAMFMTEAEKYQVFPLDNSVLPRLLTPRPSAIAGKSVLTYTGENAGIPIGNAPEILNKDYTITAEITVPKGGAEGMIATMGGRFGGYGLFVQKGKPVFVYNALDLERFRWEGGIGGKSARTCWPSTQPASTRSCSTSNTTVPAPARAAPACSRSMARSWRRRPMPHTIPMLMAIDETFDIGSDTRTGVDDGYELPFRFTGKIDKLTFKLGPSQMAETENKSAAEAIAKATD